MKAFLTVKVIPKSHKNAVVGWENDTLKIRLKAVPEKGEANATLIAFLSELFKIPKSNITLIQGDTSRIKRLCFKNISQEQLNNLLKK